MKTYKPNWFNMYRFYRGRREFMTLEGWKKAFSGAVDIPVREFYIALLILFILLFFVFTSIIWLPLICLYFWYEAWSTHRRVVKGDLFEQVLKNWSEFNLYTVIETEESNV